MIVICEGYKTCKLNCNERCHHVIKHERIKECDDVCNNNNCSQALIRKEKIRKIEKLK